MRSARRALTAVLCLAFAAIGVATGLAGAFFHDAWLDVAPVDLPVGLVLALAAQAACLLLAGAALRNRLAVLAPAVGWLVPVLGLAIPRGEGDLVVGATGPGYLLLLGGAIVIGACLAAPYDRRGRRPSA